MEFNKMINNQSNQSMGIIQYIGRIYELKCVAQHIRGQVMGI